MLNTNNNKVGRRKRFDNYENNKDDKFSVYKYERNILIGINNNYRGDNNVDDYE